jgi:hypothetical protein
LPKSREADCGVALRDPEHFADFPSGQTLEIQQGESALYRLQTLHSIEEFSAPSVFGANHGWDLVDRNLSVSLPLASRRICKSDVVSDAVEPGPLAGISTKARE